MIPLLHVDFIIRFEDYEEDLNVFERALGRNATLAHKNGSGAAAAEGWIKSPNQWNVKYNERVGGLLELPYRELYTLTAKTLVEVHFAADLVTFGYHF
jgi:hypothetical protein